MGRPLIVVGAILFGALATSNQPASVAAEAQPCLPTSADGSAVLRWTGNPSQLAVELAFDLQGIADKYPDQLTGVVICDDNRRIQVLGSDIGGEAANAIHARAAKAPTIVVALAKVPNSRGTLDALVEKVSRASLAASLNTSVAPDILTGGLAIGIQSDSPSDGAEIKSGLGAKVNRIHSVIPSSVPVRFAPSDRFANNSTRDVDRPAFSMGAAINSRNGSVISFCSLGLPVTFYGKHYAMTSGHCAGVTWYNNVSSNVVGTVYTTAYPGNAYKYGDWELLQGSTYAMSVFSGTTTQANELPISKGWYGNLPARSPVCTSGRTTGQICRYITINSGVTENFDGTATSDMLELHQDPDGDGFGNGGGFLGGDSGGACYYSDQLGGVIGAGVVQGGHYFPFTNGQSYYCAQLSGLRKWAPTAVLG